MLWSEIIIDKEKKEPDVRFVSSRFVIKVCLHHRQQEQMRTAQDRGR